MKLFTTFAALVSISAAIAEAQTTPDDESMMLIQDLGLKDELPKPGYNMEGGSVFDNYVKARREGQFFLLGDGIVQFEKPSAEIVEAKMLRWCSNLHFTGDSNSTYSRGVGYTAHCVFTFLGDSYQQADTAGSQLAFALTADEFGSTRILSASYNIQANMFDITSHNNDDNYKLLMSDTGLSTMPLIGWEAHDEGDTSPNADTSSWAVTGQMTWISTEEAARLLNNNANDFTPEKFVEVYEKVWNDNHEYAYAEPTSTGGESTNEEDEEEESTDTDIEEADENDSNTEESMTAAEDTEEEGSESDTEEEDDESSATNGRRLFVAITSMFSTLLGSSV